MTLHLCIKNAAIILDVHSELKKTKQTKNKQSALRVVSMPAAQHAAWVFTQASSIVPNQTADNTDEFEFLVEQDNDR